MWSAVDLLRDPVFMRWHSWAFDGKKWLRMDLTSRHSVQGQHSGRGGRRGCGGGLRSEEEGQDPRFPWYVAVHAAECMSQAHTASH